MKKTRSSLVAALVLSACGASPEQQALTETKAFLQKNLDSLAANAQLLCDAAPTPTGRGWDSTSDRAAIEAMKAAWKKARPDYERVEGAIAELFREVDRSIDERYDGFLENATDTNLFDDQVVTGNHAIERILWSDGTPARVVAFERELGSKYVEARFPSTEAEARDFKTKLCGRWAAETKKLAADFRPLALDPAAAFRGVLGSVQEQVEKVEKAATGEEESRYSQFTLGDMRSNLDGAKATFNAFRPWLSSKALTAHEQRIRAAFSALEMEYGAVMGDALPAAPTTWSSQMPTPVDLQTPFGRLFTAVRAAADDRTEGTLAEQMTVVADGLGIPQLPKD